MNKDSKGVEPYGFIRLHEIDASGPVRLDSVRTVKDEICVNPRKITMFSGYTIEPDDNQNSEGDYENKQGLNEQSIKGTYIYLDCGTCILVSETQDRLIELMREMVKRENRT